ncbi:MAG: hypothetical protein LLG42_15445 [Chloroflexi bacterium]|nr:hypothetical protein [Chloroflexota bacterium]
MISTPVIWIVFPMCMAILLWFLRRYRLVVVIIAVTTCLFLAMSAWILPFSGMAKVGPLVMEVTTTLSILGRRFILLEGDRFLLIFLYSLGAFWFLGEGVLRKNRNFIPLGLAIISLSVAALAVDPFLYSALIIEIIVLISIPMLLPPGSRVGQGVMRYLVFQTIAMALMLLAGWAAEGVDTNPNDTALTTLALTFLGLGVMFWMGVFPFHTWIPQMVSEVYPYQAGFLLNFLPLVIMLMALDFLNGFGWLRNYSGLTQVCQFAGAITVAAGGIWAAFEHKLNRYMGFCLIVETGFSLLALSLQSTTGYQIYVTLFLPRTLFIALWSLAMSNLELEDLDYNHLAGVMKTKPVESITLLVASFSVSGLPLLGFFPLRQTLFENLAQVSLPTALWGFAGALGLMVGSVRILLAFISSPAEGTPQASDWRVILLLVLGILLLVLVGLFPQWFVSPLFNLLNAFGNLV